MVDNEQKQRRETSLIEFPSVFASRRLENYPVAAHGLEASVAPFFRFGFWVPHPTSPQSKQTGELHPSLPDVHTNHCLLRHSLQHLLRDEARRFFAN